MDYSYAGIGLVVMVCGIALLIIGYYRMKHGVSNFLLYTFKKDERPFLYYFSLYSGILYGIILISLSIFVIVYSIFFAS